MRNNDLRTVGRGDSEGERHEANLDPSPEQIAHDGYETLDQVPRGRRERRGLTEAAEFTEFVRKF